MKRRGFLGALVAAVAAPKVFVRKITGQSDTELAAVNEYEATKRVIYGQPGNRIVGIAMGPSRADGTIDIRLQGTAHVGIGQVVTWKDLRMTR